MSQLVSRALRPLMIRTLHRLLDDFFILTKETIKSMEFEAMKGLIVLTQIQLRPSLLVARGTVGKLEIRIPWTNLSSESVVVRVYDVWIQLQSSMSAYASQTGKSSEDAGRLGASRGAKASRWAKWRGSAEWVLGRNKQATSSNLSSRTVARVMSNLNVQVERLTVSFLPTSTALRPETRLSVQALALETCDAFGQRCFSRSADSLVYRKIELQDMTLVRASDQVMTRAPLRATLILVESAGVFSLVGSAETDVDLSLTSRDLEGFLAYMKTLLEQKSSAASSGQSPSEAALMDEEDAETSETAWRFPSVWLPRGSNLEERGAARLKSVVRRVIMTLPRSKYRRVGWLSMVVELSRRTAYLRALRAPIAETLGTSEEEEEAMDPALAEWSASEEAGNYELIQCLPRETVFLYDAFARGEMMDALVARLESTVSLGEDARPKPKSMVGRVMLKSSSVKKLLPTSSSLRKRRSSLVSAGPNNNNNSEASSSSNLIADTSSWTLKDRQRLYESIMSGSGASASGNAAVSSTSASSLGGLVHAARLQTREVRVEFDRDTKFRLSRGVLERFWSERIGLRTHVGLEDFGFHAPFCALELRRDREAWADADSLLSTRELIPPNSEIAESSVSETSSEVSKILSFRERWRREQRSDATLGRAHFVQLETETRLVVRADAVARLARVPSAWSSRARLDALRALASDALTRFASSETTRETFWSAAADRAATRATSLRLDCRGLDVSIESTRAVRVSVASLSTSGSGDARCTQLILRYDGRPVLQQPALRCAATAWGDPKEGATYTWSEDPIVSTFESLEQASRLLEDLTECLKWMPARTRSTVSTSRPKRRWVWPNGGSVRVENDLIRVGSSRLVVSMGASSEMAIEVSELAVSTRSGDARLELLRVRGALSLTRESGEMWSVLLPSLRVDWYPLEIARLVSLGHARERTGSAPTSFSRRLLKSCRVVDGFEGRFHQPASGAKSVPFVSIQSKGTTTWSSSSERGWSLETEEIQVWDEWRFVEEPSRASMFVRGKKLELRRSEDAAAPLALTTDAVLYRHRHTLALECYDYFVLGVTRVLRGEFRVHEDFPYLRARTDALEASRAIEATPRLGLPKIHAELASLRVELSRFSLGRDEPETIEKLLLDFREVSLASDSPSPGVDLFRGRVSSDARVRFVSASNASAERDVLTTSRPLEYELRLVHHDTSETSLPSVADALERFEELRRVKPIGFGFLVDALGTQSHRQALGAKRIRTLLQGALRQVLLGSPRDEEVGLCVWLDEEWTRFVPLVLSHNITDARREWSAANLVQSAERKGSSEALFPSESRDTDSEAFFHVASNALKDFQLVLPSATKVRWLDYEVRVERGARLRWTDHGGNTNRLLAELSGTTEWPSPHGDRATMVRVERHCRLKRLTQSLRKTSTRVGVQAGGLRVELDRLRECEGLLSRLGPALRSSTHPGASSRPASSSSYEWSCPSVELASSRMRTRVSSRGQYETSATNSLTLTSVEGDVTELSVLSSSPSSLEHLLELTRPVSYQYNAQDDSARVVPSQASLVLGPQTVGFAVSSSVALSALSTRLPSEQQSWSTILETMRKQFSPLSPRAGAGMSVPPRDSLLMLSLNASLVFTIRSEDLPLMRLVFSKCVVRRQTKRAEKKRTTMMTFFGSEKEEEEEASETSAEDWITTATRPPRPRMKGVSCWFLNPTAKASRWEPLIEDSFSFDARFDETNDTVTALAIEGNSSLRVNPSVSFVQTLRYARERGESSRREPGAASVGSRVRQWSGGARRSATTHVDSGESSSARLLWRVENATDVELSVRNVRVMPSRVSSTLSLDSSQSLVLSFGASYLPLTLTLSSLLTRRGGRETSLHHVYPDLSRAERGGGWRAMTSVMVETRMESKRKREEPEEEERSALVVRVRVSSVVTLENRTSAPFQLMLMPEFDPDSATEEMEETMASMTTRVLPKLLEANGGLVSLPLASSTNHTTRLSMRPMMVTREGVEDETHHWWEGVVLDFSTQVSSTYVLRGDCRSATSRHHPFSFRLRVDRTSDPVVKLVVLPALLIVNELPVPLHWRVPNRGDHRGILPPRESTSSCVDVSSLSLKLDESSWSAVLDPTTRITTIEDAKGRSVRLLLTSSGVNANHVWRLVVHVEAWLLNATGYPLAFQSLLPSLEGEREGSEEGEDDAYSDPSERGSESKREPVLLLSASDASEYVLFTGKTLSCGLEEDATTWSESFSIESIGTIREIRLRATQRDREAGSASTTTSESVISKLVSGYYLSPAVAPASPSPSGAAAQDGLLDRDYVFAVYVSRLSAVSTPIVRFSSRFRVTNHGRERLMVRGSTSSSHVLVASNETRAIHPGADGKIRLGLALTSTTATTLSGVVDLTLTSTKQEEALKLRDPATSKIYVLSLIVNLDAFGTYEAVVRLIEDPRDASYVVENHTSNAIQFHQADVPDPLIQRVLPKSVSPFGWDDPSAGPTVKRTMLFVWSNGQVSLRVKPDDLTTNLGVKLYPTSAQPSSQQQQRVFATCTMNGSTKTIAFYESNETQQLSTASQAGETLKATHWSFRLSSLIIGVFDASARELITLHLDDLSTTSSAAHLTRPEAYEFSGVFSMKALQIDDHDSSVLFRLPAQPDQTSSTSEGAAKLSLMGGRLSFHPHWFVALNAVEMELQPFFLLVDELSTMRLYRAWQTCASALSSSPATTPTTPASTSSPSAALTSIWSTNAPTFIEKWAISKLKISLSIRRLAGAAKKALEEEASGEELTSLLPSGLATLADASVTTNAIVVTKTLAPATLHLKDVYRRLTQELLSNVYRVALSSLLTRSGGNMAAGLGSPSTDRELSEWVSARSNLVSREESESLRMDETATMKLLASSQRRRLPRWISPRGCVREWSAADALVLRLVRDSGLFEDTVSPLEFSELTQASLGPGMVVVAFKDTILGLDYSDRECRVPWSFRASACAEIRRAETSFTAVLEESAGDGGRNGGGVLETGSAFIRTRWVRVDGFDDKEGGGRPALEWTSSDFRALRVLSEFVAKSTNVMERAKRRRTRESFGVSFEGTRCVRVASSVSFGIKVGDVLISVMGRRVTSTALLWEALERVSEGKLLRLGVKRGQQQLRLEYLVE